MARQRFPELDRGIAILLLSQALDQLEALEKAAAKSVPASLFEHRAVTITVATQIEAGDDDSTSIDIDIDSGRALIAGLRVFLETRLKALKGE
jgi:hypothetical protein